MLKEILEQEDATVRSMGIGGRIENDTCVKLGGLSAHRTELMSVQNLIILACPK